uniref:P-type sodium-transporting ATPase4 n=1 Tax=Chromera velia CCMP2878 TaxID=1169474 RepID=A0A0G4F8M6_9ALVE|eukprot:Cvel_2924.t1-p1 / transcript=Cvel_2924.t1 / gene=Cvel_2924 / organism=Chromera_velia_CCMP2878 / gene_product=Calcium-transporting ATPase 1, endoplasmic, putative / transcript_product=Calcium-transporting ATPase 1, endoplasmic, putative / location=Cvel_scaffold115:99417-106943(+) / protein_length=1197 / sequence_SO=supercontig / SO=protein_coding / is_pseudo=false
MYRCAVCTIVVVFGFVAVQSREDSRDVHAHPTLFVRPSKGLLRVRLKKTGSPSLRRLRRRGDGFLPLPAAESLLDISRNRLSEGFNSAEARRLSPLVHTLDVGAVCEGLSVDRAVGLGEEEAARRLELCGANELPKGRGKSVWELFAEQFDDLLVKVLLAAAVVSFSLAVQAQMASSPDGGPLSFSLTEFSEPLVILLILIANAAVGVTQQLDAAKALQALQDIQPRRAVVLREGEWRECGASELVPGDVVEVRVGDKVPADLRVLQLETTALRSEEAALTGESVPTAKGESAVGMAGNCSEIPLSSRRCMLFSSCTIAHGRAVGVVTGTGSDTEIGRVQSAVEAAAEETGETPLQKELDGFGETLTKLISGICLFVWALNFRNFLNPVYGGVVGGAVHYFKSAVALAVAAIPEGLPAVISSALALGTRRLASRNAIVRRLSSVETLGSTTVICSDKTGTLTRNEMVCSELILPAAKEGSAGLLDLSRFRVSGLGYSPEGSIERIYADEAEGNLGPEKEGKEAEMGVKAATSVTPSDALDEQRRLFCLVAETCNDAVLVQSAESEEGRWTRRGDPTEAALLALSAKLRGGVKAANANGGWGGGSTGGEGGEKKEEGDLAAVGSAPSERGRRLATLEFSRERKSMSVLSPFGMGEGNSLLVKGAPESILDRAAGVVLPSGEVEYLDDASREEVLMKEVEGLASRGLRTLALAVRRDCGELSTYDGSTSHSGHASLQDPEGFAHLERNLLLLGIVGIEDPPREEVKGAIEECRAAGIRVMIITGDSGRTASAIGRRVGLGADGRELVEMSGSEFVKMSSERQREVLRGLNGADFIFCRAEPSHKQAIVRALRDNGEVCAMTGDGVNDAPALRLADIGVAMGEGGTAVAKEAADMVLADDRFETIVSAVKEGRVIFANMKSFIRYLVSSNIGEVAAILGVALLGLPEVLLPVQLLWVNLVTDGPPALALSFNPPEEGVMSRKPRRSEDGLVGGFLLFRFFVVGAFVGLATVSSFIGAFGDSPWGIWGSSLDGAGGSGIGLEELRQWSACGGGGGEGVAQLGGSGADRSLSEGLCTSIENSQEHAHAVAFSVLVVCQMLNALNALSERGSLLSTGLFANPALIFAIAISMAFHCAVLYVPFLSEAFGVVPLGLHDWAGVLAWSLPVIVIDEALKAFARNDETPPWVSEADKAPPSGRETQM